MAIKLSGADHEAMNVMIDRIMAAHSSGKASVGEARDAIAHVITAAAIGNEGELRGWLRPETVDDWEGGL